MNKSLQQKRGKLTSYVKKVIGRDPLEFPLVADGFPIATRGDMKIVPESFNILGQVVLGIYDRFWRRQGGEAFFPIKSVKGEFVRFQ